MDDRRGVGYVATQTSPLQKTPYDLDKTLRDEEPLKTIDTARSEVDELPPVQPTESEVQPDANLSQNNKPFFCDVTCEPMATTVSLLTTPYPNEPCSIYSEHPKSLLIYATKWSENNATSIISGPCLFADEPGESDDDGEY